MNKPSLSVSMFWICLNPNFHQEPGQPASDRLETLHQALHGVHAGLWVQTKPHVPRFRTKTVQIDGKAVDTYLLCHNGAFSRDRVLEVVRASGFELYVEPTPTPFLPEVAQVAA